MSVLRSTRQIPLSTTYYNAAGVTTSNAYEFVSSAGNTVGNYPPGYVQALTSLPSLTGKVLRDMGKTISAPVGDLSGAVGFFRQVQLLAPSSSSTGGVLGDANTPDSNADFYTFYMAVPVGGILAGTFLALSPIAGGQM